MSTGGRLEDFVCPPPIRTSFLEMLPGALSHWRIGAKDEVETI